MKNFEGLIAQVLSKYSKVCHSFCRVKKPGVLGFRPETPLLSGTLEYGFVSNCVYLRFKGKC